MASILESAFMLSPEASLAFDDDGNVLAANTAAADLFGLPIEEIVGNNLRLLGPSAPYDFRPGIARLVEAGVTQGELKMTRGDGQPFDAEYKSRANVLPQVHLTVIRDVSDRKRVEASLRASEELFARSFISAPVALCATDLSTLTCHLANEEFLRVTGYWRSEVVGSDLPLGRLWADPADRGRIRESGGGTREVSWLRKDGSAFSAMVSVATTQVTGRDYEVLAATFT